MSRPHLSESHGCRAVRWGWVYALTAGALVLAACGSSGSAGSGGATPSTGSTPVRSAPLWAAPGTASLPTPAAAALQASLDAWVKQGTLKGATAAVVTPAGVWAGAAGVDGAKTALRADSSFWIASITKTFTAAEVMLLSSRGLVDLDKPLTEYIDVPFDTQGATVRQALAMRTGFPNTTIKADYQDLGAALGREWTVAETLARVPRDAPRSSPGATPEYNSVNYQLLGELIATVTKQSLAQAIRADLLDPAGLQRTWVQTTETPAPPLTVGTNPPGATLVDPAGAYLPSRSVASATSAAGGMAGDAADVARWGYLLYGGRVIDSSLVKQMEADPQPEPNVGMYALGTTVATDASGIITVGHGGGGPNWPYTGIVWVWTGDPPVAVAVLTPQPADFPTAVYDLVMQLHDDAAG
jgi:D-alanyl-D-alanine carboxypeptidase